MRVGRVGRVEDEEDGIVKKYYNDNQITEMSYMSNK